jgi:ribosome-interacting GTPase 1
MEYRGARIQILDLPGIIEGAAAGRGVGKRVLSVARNADLVLIVLDVFQPHNLGILKNELAEIGIKIDQKPPNVIVEKTSIGGVSVNILVPTKLTQNFIKEILRISGIHNGRITIRETDLTEDQLIDVLNGNRIYVNSLTVLNKIDLVNQGFVREIQSKIGNNFIPISADANINMRPKRGETDYQEPMIIRNGSTVGDVCSKVHRNMIKDFRFAQIWGRSAKFNGQKVGLDHILRDEDVLTIVKKMNTI